MPTIRGPVKIAIENDCEGPFAVRVDIPENMTAKVGLPQSDPRSKSLIVNGKNVETELKDGYLFYDNLGSGQHVLTTEFFSL